MTSIRSLAIRTLLVATTVTGALAATGAPTAAYTPSGGGYPGNLATPRTVGTYIDSTTGSIFYPTRTVTKSARYAAYDQWVCIQYNVVYAVVPATSWQVYRNARTCGWISAGAASRVFPGARFTVITDPFIFSGYIQITWQLSNGALVGWRTLDYNQVGDYTCYGCQIPWTYSLGAYLLF